MNTSEEIRLATKRPAYCSTNSVLAYGEIAAQMVANVWGRDWDAFDTIPSDALLMYHALTTDRGRMESRS